MDHNIGGFAQHRRGVIGHRHAPWRIGSVHHIAQILACLGRIGIDGPNDFDGFLFPHQPHNCSSDGADAVLHRANFLFHDRLRRAYTRTIVLAGVPGGGFLVHSIGYGFWWGPANKIGANTIKQSRGAFNRIRLLRGRNLNWTDTSLAAIVCVCRTGYRAASLRAVGGKAARIRDST